MKTIGKLIKGFVAMIVIALGVYAILKKKISQVS
jgi:hypothetical protein